MRTREAEIVRFLKREKPEGSPDGDTVKEIWEALQKSIGDAITIQAYHRIINMMVARGKLLEIGGQDDDSRRFTVAAYLTPENALSLSDIEEGLWTLDAPEAVANYIDALDYFEGRQGGVLKKAAEALLDENPVELVVAMLQDKLARLAEDLSNYHDPQTRDGGIEKQISMRHDELVTLVHSSYGLSEDVVDLGDVEDVKAKKHIIQPDWERIRAALQTRLYGNRVLYWVEPDKDFGTQIVDRIIGGSDGSTHAGWVHVVPGAEFVEDAGQMVLTFNNAIARLQLPIPMSEGFEFPYHGVPMTRAALEDPSNRGMILARPFYPNLTDSEYEHMKKSALDVVQFRVDEKVISGTARAFGSSRIKGAGNLLPKPHVHLRDGTVVPQERELNHYGRRDAYGEMVREGIALSYSILRAVKDSRHLVFGGAVKSTQLKAYSTLLNWYISRGSARKFKEPIDPQWDVSRAGRINDNHAMTRLLIALGSSNRRCLCSFAILRPFPQVVTELYRKKEANRDWVKYFEENTAKRAEDRTKWGGPLPYLANVEIADDPYVRMCSEADYVMFYVGHTAAEPTPVIPRYEFLDSLRNKSPEDARSRVAEKMKLMIQSIMATGFSIDTEHNFLSKKRVSRIIPSVLYDAHEKCKVLGHKLEAELKSAIVAKLAELKRRRGITSTKLDISPIEIKTYLTSMHDALAKDNLPQLPKGENNKD